MNEMIILLLTELRNQYKEKRNIYRVKAFDVAIANIKSYDNEIISGDHARKEIDGIGEGIASRIDEILRTGTLEELKTSDRSITIATEILKGVTGIGNANALKYVKQGIYTLEELQKAHDNGKIELTHHQLIGLKYYDDFNERIPRKEMIRMEKLLLKESIKYCDQLIICGSYRRGLATSGDIDVLITSNESCLQEFVKHLHKIKFLIDDLTTLGKKKYMGVAKIAKVARRIDIRYIEPAAFWAAVIYFTGSKEFNIMIRNEALKQGYSLNEYGLKKDGKLIHLKSENEVFDILGMKYIEPTER